MSEKYLTESFLRLRKIQPVIFDECVKDFERYTWQVTAAVTHAPPEAIYQAQGMARQCQAILRALQECHLRERLPQPPTS